jgi:hypothetical protein
MGAFKVVSAAGHIRSRKSIYLLCKLTFFFVPLPASSRLLALLELVPGPIAFLQMSSCFEETAIALETSESRQEEGLGCIAALQD